MSSGERPIGAAKGKQSDTEALCQPPPPPRLQSSATGPRAVRSERGIHLMSAGGLALPPLPERQPPLKLPFP